MEGNRGLSIVAGVIIGAFLGFYIYFLPGYFLKCGPIESTLIPDDVRLAFVMDAITFGLIPGVIIGFLGGAVTPFHLPRGHMSKSIGAFAWIPITILAWVTQWENVYRMTGSRIAITVFLTLVSFLLILPISNYFQFIEKMREK